MKLREALIAQAPSLALQRAAADEIARLDALAEDLQRRMRAAANAAMHGADHGTILRALEGKNG